MSYQISELIFPENIINDYKSIDWPSDRITNLSRLNVFIGPNNSGKSRFVRELFSSESLHYVYNINLACKIKRNLYTLFKYVTKNIGDTGDDKWLKESVHRLRIPAFKENSTELQNPGEMLRALRDIKNDVKFRIIGRNHRPIRRRINELYNSVDKYKDEKDTTKFKKIYIPALRGLRVPKGIGNFYRDRTITDYFEASKRFKKNQQKDLIDLEIVTGLGLYDKVKKHLLGTLKQRELIAEYQNFLGKRFFKGEQVVLIPRENSDVLFVKIGNEEEQPIYKLGDGIQHLIILTIPMFIHRDKKLLMFVEEPELYMHPGFQRLFIETVLEESKNIDRQVFVATHSSQFLDLTLDEEHISVYKLNKEISEEALKKKSILPKFTIENTSNDDFSILEELGIRNSSVMLANCTIWVEGITDRLYLRKYLEIYQQGKNQDYIEDMHYSFVEYGGANLVHWSFLDEDNEGIYALRISNKIFLIKDKDSGKITPSDAKLEESLGKNYHRLYSREIENSLTPNVIEGVIRDYEGDKIEISHFGKTDYKDEYLGKFIDETLLADKQARKFSAKSGTVKDKVTFARKALDHIQSKDDISDEAMNLAEKVFEFIKRNNEEH